jgi:NhaP-type Na+/H+ and K+/H+ antiporter
MKGNRKSKVVNVVWTAILVGAAGGWIMDEVIIHKDNPDPDIWIAFIVMVALLVWALRSALDATSSEES